MTRRAVLALEVLLAAGGRPVAAAQSPVRGRVVAAENGQALPDASVYALVARHGARSDRHGRFVLWLGTFPDTLIARFIGRVPDTLVLGDSAPGEVVLLLESSAVPLAGVVVQGDPGRRADDASTPAVWSLPREALAAVPSAVEADVLRGLALSPAVSYSSPFSSQPFVRGTDPGAVGYRLDGFTLINPFHLGRIFSALMPQAVQSATLAVAPFGEEFGDATSGVVDAHLREGGDEVRGGAQASFVSAAAWLGGPLRDHRWFVAWRHGYLEHLGGPFNEVPYRLNDVYARLAITPGPWGPLHVTAFWSEDRAFHRETGQGVTWGNALLGLRLPLALGRAGQVELWAEASGFSEDVVDLPIRHADTDVENRFTTGAAGARFQWTRARGSVSLAGELRHRRMVNRILEGDVPSLRSNAAGLVGAAVVGLSHRRGRLTGRLGLRVDAAGSVVAWQPRVRLGTDLGGGWSVGAALGRTAKLYQVIAEVLPEVEDIVSVYDLWRPAGNGTPLPRGDHGLVEVRYGRPGFSLRASAFAALVGGVGEVRPAGVDTGDATFFRFGRGRVWGADAELSATGARRSVSLAYVLSWSRRTWDSDDAIEIPWRHDRRHQGRVFFTWFTGRGWRFNALADLTSADPITPATGTMEAAGLHPGEGSLNRNPGSGLALVFGPENSARGGWMGHADLGIQKEFGGPGRSVGRLGVSVLNVAFTRVGPAAPEIDFDEVLGLRVVYRPRLFLPPVPTLTLGLEF